MSSSSSCGKLVEFRPLSGVRTRPASSHRQPATLIPFYPRSRARSVPISPQTYARPVKTYRPEALQGFRLQLSRELARSICLPRNLDRQLLLGYDYHQDFPEIDHLDSEAQSRLLYAMTKSVHHAWVAEHPTLLQGNNQLLPARFVPTPLLGPEFFKQFVSGYHLLELAQELGLASSGRELALSNLEDYYVKHREDFFEEKLINAPEDILDVFLVGASVFESMPPFVWRSYQNDRALAQRTARAVIRRNADFWV